jgi:predicted ribosomally synthesized peptide with SipW-like signal peptide
MTPDPSGQTPNRIDLTRRKVLAGLGAVGLASAGAGLGTSALFSDRESFEGNVFTAGELDLAVRYDAVYNGSPAENLAPTPSGTVDGDPGLFYTLDDVKPGDSGSVNVCFELNTNPAYLWFCTTQTADGENGQNEPELEAEGADTDGLGELDDAIVASAFYCDEQGVPIDGGDIATDVTLAGLLAAFAGGQPLNAAAVDAVAGDQAPYPPSAEPGATTGPCICIEWALPVETGNEVQSDTLAFDIVFHAVQARNTDGTLNPCTGESDLGSGDGDGGVQQPAPPQTDFEDETDDGWQLFGDATTADAQVVSSGGNPGAYLEGVDTATGGIWYFDAPGSFLGDQSAFAGGALGYDLQQSPDGTLVRDDVVLVGAGTTLVYRYDSVSEFPAVTPAWSEYETPLDTTAGWTVGSATGPAATPTEIAAVLGDLTALRIRGEFVNGNDTGGLDNPRFIAPSP